MRSDNTRWWLLGGMTIGFFAATFLLPWHMATAVTGLTWAGPNALADSVGQALIADWTSAVPAPGAQASSALMDPTRFWRWFHIAKAFLACAALVASIIVIVRARRAGRIASTRGRRLGWMAVAASGCAAALLAVVLVLANVQGAVAPLSSVLSFLPYSGRNQALNDAVTALNASVGSGQPTPTASAIVGDFATYHAVVAVLMAIVAVSAALMTVRVARDRRWGATTALVATVAIFAVLTIANTSTAMAPVPALQSFLSGVA